jgi:hypothetical protein
VAALFRHFFPLIEQHETKKINSLQVVIRIEKKFGRVSIEGLLLGVKVKALTRYAEGIGVACLIH